MKSPYLLFFALLMLSPGMSAQTACAIRVDLRWYVPPGAIIRDPRNGGQPLGSKDFPLVQIIKNRFGQTVWSETVKNKYPEICLSPEHADYFVFWGEIPRSNGVMVRVFPRDASGCVVMLPAPVFQADKQTNDSERSLKQAFKETVQFLRNGKPSISATAALGCVSPETIENPDSQASEPQSDSLPAPALPSSKQTTLDISSSPPGADIELDGRFVGNTPSSLAVSLGEHTIRVTKSGYKRWERKINALAGKISIAAELELETKPTQPQ